MPGAVTGRRARLRRPRSLDWQPRARDSAVRPSARPQRVLDPRWGVPDRPARGQGGRARDAGRRAHRPRLDGGGGGALAGGREGRRQADPGLRDVRGRRPRGPRPEGAPRPPHAAGRDDRGVPQPRAAGVGGLPRRLLVPAAGRPRPARRRTPRASSRCRAACRAASARRSWTATSRSPASELDTLVQIFGRDDVYVELQDGGIDIQTAHQPAAGGARHRCGPAAGRHRRRPLPDRGRRHPARGPAVHPDQRHARQPEPVPVLEPRLLPEEPAGDVRPDGAAVGRGHAAAHGRDRRALQRAASSSTRCTCPSSTSPTARRPSPTCASWPRPACASATARRRPSCAAGSSSSCGRSRRWASPTTS